MQYFFKFAFILLFLTGQQAIAATCAGADSGKQRYSAGTLEFCDGSNWYAMGGASLGSCTAPDAGKIIYSASTYQVCNSTDWLTLKGDVGASCAGTTAGTQRYSGGEMEFCDGTNWYNMKSCNVVLANYMWTGAGGNTNWNTAANWYNNLIPGAGDIAKFNECASGANKTVLVNAAISVAGIQTAANFTGTITQGAGNTITVGASGWTQSAGTFVGGNSTIALTGPFSLSGGAFTSTSGSMNITDYGVAITGGTFTHNSGSVVAYLNDGAGAKTLALATTSFNNLTISGFNGNYTLTGTPTVLGTLTLNDNSSGSLSGGTIEAKGNVVATNNSKFGTTLIKLSGTGNQTLDCSAATACHLPSVEIASTATLGLKVTTLGVMKVHGNWTYTSGDVDFSASTLQFLDYNGYRTAQIIPGIVTYGNLTLNGYGITHNFNVGTMTVGGDLSLADTSSMWAILTNGFLDVKGNFSMSGNGAKGTAPIVMSGNTNKTFSINPATVNIYDGPISINKSIGNTVSATTNIILNATGQDFTVTSGTMDMAGFNLTVKDVLTVGVNGTLLCSGGTLTVTGSIVNSGVIDDCIGYGFIWTGLAGNNNWNTPGNWSGGAVPGAGDIAVFGTLCSGAACNVTINAAASVLGIKMRSGYTGTITQGAGNTITVGASGWVQEGGTFVGGNSNVTLAINAPFTLTGGTYTATSATTTMSGNPTFTYSAGTFNHGSGTWKFDTQQSGYYANQTYTITTTPASVTFYNLYNGGGSNYEHANYSISVGSGKTVIVEGDLTFANTFGGLGNPCMTGGGTFDLRGNLKSTKACSDSTAYLNGKILFSGTANQTYQFPSGNLCKISGTYHECTLPQFEINKASGNVTAFAGTTDLGIASFNLISGTFQAPTGIMNTRLGFSQSGGTFDHNNGTFAFDHITPGNSGNINYSLSISAANVTFNNFNVAGSSDYVPFDFTLTIPSGKTIIALGSLTLSKSALVSGHIYSNGGTIEVQGNMTLAASAYGGTTAVKFTGTNAQSYINASGATNLSGTFTVDKASNTLTLSNNLIINSASQDLTINSGVIDLNGKTLTVNDKITLEAAGTFTVNAGSYSPLHGTGNFIDNGGTFNP